MQEREYQAVEHDAILEGWSLDLGEVGEAAFEVVLNGDEITDNTML